MLVSGDGFPLEAVTNDASLVTEEVAALARDGAAAARRMVAELDEGQFIQGIIEYSKGTVLFTNLPLQMTLVLVGARGADKGALWNAAAANFREVVSAL